MVGGGAVRFDGRVAVVTGAGRGLGAAYARLLATLGAAVVVHDAGVALDGTGSDPSVADAVVASIVAVGGTAVASHEDLARPAAAELLIDLALARFGRIDALVNNAGLLVVRPIEEMDDALLERFLRVGVDAPYRLCRAAFPVMRRQGYGRIVLTASGRAMYVNAAMPDLSAYAMAKGAQLGLLVGLAAEGEPFGIRINAISPVASTRMTLRREPGPRDPDLVAPGVAYLASSACDVSGVVVRASGGRFSAARWAFSDGVDLGPGPVTVDDVAERWAEISGA
jgi:NAD(P)-dependent dehydrogenase (short-subunit alcohol dehydrogenase family)